MKTNGETEPKVAILILNWNGWLDTIDCLGSVQRLSYPNYQVVVLDNGSTDDSLRKIRAWCSGSSTVCVEYDTKTAELGGRLEDEDELSQKLSKERLVLIRSQENMGFAGGSNTAIRYALRSAEPAEFVFLLNNDAQIDPHCLSRAVNVSGKHNASVVACVVKDADTGNLLFTGDHRPSKLFYVSYYWYRHKLQDDEPSNIAWGTAMMIRRDAVLEAEGHNGFVFDPQLFLYAEDNDFSMRMIDMGQRIYLASRACVYHKQTDSCLNKKFKNAFLLYYSTRNTILVARRHIQGLWLLFFYVYYPTVRLKDVLV